MPHSDVRAAGLLVLASLFAGCEDESSARRGLESLRFDPQFSQSMDPGFDPALEVIRDPRLVEAFRRLAGTMGEAGDVGVAQYLAEPWREDALVRFQADRDHSIREAKLLASDLGDPARAGAAAVLLLQLGAPEALSVLETALRHRDPALRLAAMDRLRVAALQDDGLRVEAAAHEGVRDALLELLAGVAPDAQAHAVTLAGVLQLQEAIPQLRTLATSDDAAIADEALFWLASMDRSPRVLDLLRPRLLQGEEPRFQATWALESWIALHDEPPPPAIAMLAEALLSDMAEATPETAAEDLSLMATLADHRGVEALPVLRQVATEHPVSWVRGVALDLIADQLKLDALPMLADMTADPAMAAHAWHAVGQAAAGTGSDAAIDLLASATAADDEQAEAIASAALTVGGPRGAALAESLAGSVSPDLRQRILWRTQGITLEEAASTLREHGLIGAVTVDTAKQRLREAFGDDAGDLEVPDLFRAAGLLTEFEVEAGVVPAGHDRLIRDFAAHTRGRVRIDAAHEEMNRQHPEDWEADYTVGFLHDGRLYRFQARNLGPWYDVEAVVFALNRAMEDAGLSERFLPLAEEGQWAQFVFAEPDSLEEAAAALHLPLPTRGGAAADAGAASEGKTLGQLAGEPSR